MEGKKVSSYLHSGTRWGKSIGIIIIIIVITEHQNSSLMLRSGLAARCHIEEGRMLETEGKVIDDDVDDQW